MADAPAQTTADPLDERGQRSRDLELLATVMSRMDLDALASKMADAYERAIPSFERMHGTAPTAHRRARSRQILDLFHALARSQRQVRDADLDEQRAGARSDARAGVPLEDLLQALRIGGMVAWQEVMPHWRPEEHMAAVTTGEFYAQFTEALSTAVTAAYHDELVQMGGVDAQRQRELFRGIVHGEGSERDLAELARELAFPLRSAYVPFAASSLTEAPHELARRLRGPELFALAETSRVAGFVLHGTAADALTDAEVVYAEGMETERPRLAAALEDVRTLVALGARAGRSGAITEREYLLERCLARAPCAAAALDRALIAPLRDHDAKHRSDLVATLEVFVRSGLSRKSAAVALHIHPNTLDYRLDQIRHLTDLRLSEPSDIALAVLALTDRPPY